jgi:1,4-alpha-glucan branching enzyme
MNLVHEAGGHEGGIDMIKRTTDGRGEVALTFSLCTDDPVSVVGDFNGWDPLEHPLRRRSNGSRSAVLHVPAGTELRFRYLADGGHWFDDPDVDRLEADEFGDQHGVLVA